STAAGETGRRTARDATRGKPWRPSPAPVRGRQAPTLAAGGSGFPPVCGRRQRRHCAWPRHGRGRGQAPSALAGAVDLRALLAELRRLLGHRSEEHTSELQSRENLVCRLLLERKKVNHLRF